ncbi:MAG: S-layer homology domain-containing protein [Eubacteriales bacterium]
MKAKYKLLLPISVTFCFVGAVFASSDSLISLDFLENTYLAVMQQAQEEGISQGMDTLYQDKLEELESLQNEFSHSNSVLTLTPNSMLALPQGSVLVPIEGEMAIETQGSVVNLSTGELQNSGLLKTGNQYLVAENTNAIVRVGSSAVKVTVQGAYQISAGTTDSAMSFLDVTTSDWFYTAVKFVIEKNLFAGTSDNFFQPNEFMNRGMMVTVLYRLAGSPEEELKNATASFVDVYAGDWYDTFVSWGGSQELVAGMGDGYFMPNLSVRRQEVAIMLYCFAEKYLELDMSHTGDLSSFHDSDQVPSWSSKEMAWMVGKGLFYGIPESSYLLKPADYASRAEVAMMLYNFYIRYLQ